MVASFVHSALNVNLYDPQFYSLSLSEFSSAQSRQDSLTNKANVGIYFAETLGPASNISNTYDLESDTAYQNSISAIDNVNSSQSSVISAMNFIDSMPTVVVDDYANNTSTYGSVVPNSSQQGTIEHANDEDWFWTYLDAGQSYEIDVQGQATGNGSLSDPYLWGIYDSVGNWTGVEDDDSGVGLDAYTTFTPASSGSYYVAVQGAFGSTGSYTVSVNSGDDYSADIYTYGAVMPDTSEQGVIATSGDEDWFWTYLDAGQSYEIDVQGHDSGNGTLSDPYLWGIYDNAGNWTGITDDDSGIGLDSYSTFTPASSGSYYVAVQGALGSTGSYTVSVNSAVSYDYSADVYTAGSVLPNSSEQGVIGEVGDEDWFWTYLNAGQTYEIDVQGQSTGNGTLSDPYLWGIYDSAGNWTGVEDDDGGIGLDSYTSFTPSISDYYYLSVIGVGDATGSYVVEIA